MTQPSPPVDVQATLDEVVASATISLFEHAGITLTLRPTPDRPMQATIAGLVGFTSDAMRGGLMVASTFALFAETRPLEVRDQALSEQLARDWLYLRDWASELANQLIGRIKNRLFSLGVNLRIATPTALSGNALAVATPKSKRARPMVFSSSAGEVWVFWDAIVDPDLELRPRDDDAHAVGEGDLLLF